MLSKFHKFCDCQFGFTEEKHFITTIESKKKKKKERDFKEIFRKMRLVKLNLTISSEKSKETNFYCYRHDSFTNEISIVINFSNSIQKCICGLLHIFREETTFSLKSSVVI